MDDYLNLVLNTAFENQSIPALLSLMLLTLARLFPIILLAPFLGAKLLPHPVKVVFGMSLFIIFLPLLLKVTVTPLAFNLWLFFLMCKELFIGFFLGMIINIPFFVVQNAGMLIDHQRGGSSLMINDPTVQAQTSPLGSLNNQVLIVIFYMIGGPFLFIDAIALSYEVVPPDQVLSPRFFTEQSPFWQVHLHVFNDIMVASVQLAAPGLIMILMTDVFLGIVNRLAPQVQITFLGLPLKSFLALAIVTLGWKVFIDFVSVDTIRHLEVVRKVVNMMSF